MTSPAVLRRSRPRWWLERRTAVMVAGCGGAAIVALLVAVDAGVRGVSAVPDVARGVAATAGLFGLCGFAVTRVLLPPALAPHRPLFVVPVGAAVAALGLTVLCFAGLSFRPALVVLVVLASVGAMVVLVRGHGGPSRDRTLRAGSLLRLVVPAYLATLVVAVAMIPVFRAGYATVVGQNGDAVMAVGTAEFLREAPPTAVRPDLPVDRMPPVWRSKYPIYYALAAATEVSGLQTTQLFSSLMAVMLGLVALGVYLLARDGLRAPPAAALLAMALVPLDRILMYLAIHPYHNQIWGEFALLFILIFGFAFLREPDRRSALLFVGFLALGAFAYPLMLPFPLLTLSVAAVVLRRATRETPGGPPRWIEALRLPRGRRSALLWIPLGVIAVPLVGLLVLGAAEKGISALEVILPGSDLRGWNALPEYLPFHRFFGLVDPLGINWLLLAGVAAAALAGLRSIPREARVGLGATAAGALLFGAYFKARQFGAFFYFKDLSFLGPQVLLLAVLGTAWLARDPRRTRRVAGLAGATVLTAFVVAGTRAEIDATYDFLNPRLMQVGDWSRALPAGASVRVDEPFGGGQLWINRELSSHPLSVVSPAPGTTFPHPPAGRKADYILAPTGRAPLDHQGRPLFSNSGYAVYRQRPDVPGPDISSRRDVVNFSSVFK